MFKDSSKMLLSRLQYMESGLLDQEVDDLSSSFTLKTGYSNLDKFFPLYPGLYVLGAISSLGKTTFMNQMSFQIAEQGNTVVFFSYEQSRLELISKSISRITHKSGNGVTSLDIRRGLQSETVNKAKLECMRNGANEYIYEAQFGDSIDVICEVVDSFVSEGRRPVVIVDYLQIIAPSKIGNRIMTSKESIDDIVQKLKFLQRKHKLTIFLISSLNRQNYLSQIDFESFKESGGIEYTADVVFGMQLVCMNEAIFSSQTNVNKKRERVMQAKSEVPRQVELICLKNRYGETGYKCRFNYYPKFDYFEAVDEDKKKSDNSDLNLLV